MTADTLITSAHTHRLSDAVSAHVERVMQARCAQLEQDCAMALALTDPRRLRSLQVVYVDTRFDWMTIPGAVACSLSSEVAQRAFGRPESGDEGF